VEYDEEKMSFSLEGPAAEPLTIKVYGLLGKFHVENSEYLVRYVSTFANPLAGPGQEGHKEILEVLKPMRERLKASELHSLSSLLQRDLNDQRVAQELVPYLQGAGGDGIGFFPAILAVLVPRDYLSGTSTLKQYPIPTQNAKDTNRVDYDGCWSVTHYVIGEQTVPLGLLEIMKSSAEIVVLDGQHRANAFRYLSGDFDPSKDIYQSFYDDVPSPQPLNADLPVTLIWFEASDGKIINPQMISRRLFVDVNNNAKTVSVARNILLNDRAATCLGTQELYNRCAQDNNFKPDRFSLLHSAFDVDSEPAKRRQHRFMLTTPEIIHDMLLWGMFSSTTYDELSSYKVGRMHDQRNTVRFRKIFWNFADVPIGGGDNEEDKESLFGPYFEDPTKAQEFRSAFRTAYLPVLWTFFNELALLTPHYEAAAATASHIETLASPTEMDVWNKVFCGGEGLYWTLDPDKAKGKRSKEYIKAIASIEERFSEERAKIFGDSAANTDGLYRSFATKAFQIGFVGAVEYLARDVTAGDYVSAAQKLVNRLNAFTYAQWTAIFNDLKPLLIPGLDPKFWPTYRNLLLRMYDGDRGNLYDAFDKQPLEQWPAPDGRAYAENLARALNQLKAAYEDNAPPDSEIEKRARRALEETNALLADCGLSAPWFDFDTVLGYGIRDLKRKIDDYYNTGI
jgi:hypothetical protein